MVVGRKWPSVDIINLYTNSNSSHWNMFLNNCLKHRDVVSLKKTLYGIQAGMADAQKKGMGSDKINMFFIRLQRSIEVTAKKIYRLKYPNPLDAPGNIGKYSSHLGAKRKRDHEFELFLRESSF